MEDKAKKRPWQSKTLWINLIIAALVLLVPGLDGFIKSYPEFVVITASVINLALRIITVRGIKL